MINPADFLSTEELTRRQQILDDRGLRATGSATHTAYVDDLVDRLREVGVSEVRTEALAMRRWTPSRWELSVDGDEVAVASYIAYSGRTGPLGVTGALSTTPGPGVIGVVEVPPTRLPGAVFDALDWDAPHLPAHAPDYDPQALYERIWLAQDPMRDALTRFQEAGAVGLVIVVDLPPEQVTGGYLLYDGVHRDLPAVVVDRQSAARVRVGSDLAAPARLVLEAHVEQVQTHNVIGLVPGCSDELVVLHSHTDGPNGLEDNGPEAIVAMAAYLAGLPRPDLPRGVLVLLSTGHFALEEAWGVEEFLSRHREDLVPRIAAVLTLEHLGARPSRVDRDGHPPATGYEMGCSFVTPHRALIDVVRRAMTRADVGEPRVLRPYVPDTSGRSPDGTTWPGDGCPFWHAAGLPAANFITGPDYLLNVEPVMSFIDVEALRRQAVAFTDAVLELCATPREELRTRTESGAS